MGNSPVSPSLFPYSNLEHASGRSTPLSSCQVRDPASSRIDVNRIISISEGRLTVAKKCMKVQ